ncbi:glutathione S-transferase [Caldovatus sp. SYSU G05006]|uniref:Glutathione S-transferase n=2 Tax=Caldovatus aquaticus TaxID=2865671 RepID=A0ABS7F6H7_9PROT|nr:glutathione S-transferase [Caldovatus aquaticus]
MVLHWSSRSPFVRKVMVVAHETGQAGRIRTERVVVSARTANPEVMRDNPLGKIPTLRLPDGTVLYDSAVICEYLDSLHDGPRLYPPAGPARWTALRRHALGNGLLDNLVLWRGAREWPHRLADLEAALAAKTQAALDALEAEAEALAATPFSIGHVAIGVALAYLDFRFGELGWRAGRPALAAWHAEFAARPSVRATAFVDVT